jgi:hypothetical protein
MKLFEDYSNPSCDHRRPNLGNQTSKIALAVLQLANVVALMYYLH